MSTCSNMKHLCTLSLILVSFFRFSTGFLPFHLKKLPVSQPFLGFKHRPQFSDESRSRVALWSSASDSLAEINRRQQQFRDLLYNPPSYIIDAIDKHSIKRLTVSDIASLTGVSFSTAKRDTMILAYLSHATIQVSEEGVLYFLFPDKLKETIRNRSFRYNLQKNFDQYILPILNQTIRISVGGFLLLSLALVAITLATASASMSYESGSSSSSSNKRRRRDDDEEDERRYQRSRNYQRSPVNIHFFFDISDIFTLFARHYQNKALLDRMEKFPLDRAKPLEINMNFLEACFSFLFGDGNPNEGYEEKLAVEAAEYIRKQQGVVVAEQLIPFLTKPPLLPSQILSSQNARFQEDGESFRTVDETFLLPLLIKYNGNQIVTKEGTILYKFEELLKSGGSVNTDPRQKSGGRNPFARSETSEIFNEQDVRIIKELEVPFSLAKPNQIAMATGLGIMNVMGIAILGDLLRSPRTRVAIFSHFPGSLLARFYPFFFLYSIGFVAIPFIRGIYNRRQNGEIKERNEKRNQWFQFFKNWKNNRELKEKLLI
eukprot:gene15607-17495_t